jgi:hypothetical protein
MWARAAAIGLVIAMAGCGPPPRERSGTPRQISASGKGAYEAALVSRIFLDGGFVTAWYDTRDGNAEIYMRRLDANGNPAGPERRLTHSPEESYEPSITGAGPDVVVAWYDKTPDGQVTAKLGVWTPDGVNRWTTTLAAPGRNPVLSTGVDGIFCAWIAPGPDETEWVWVQWWTVDGSPAGPPRAAGRAGKTTWNLNAFGSDHGYASVVFDATAGTKADEVFIALVSPEKIDLRRVTEDDGIPSKYPDGAGLGLLALTWYDERDGNKEIYLLSATDREILEGRYVLPPRRVTATPGESIGAYVEWDGRGPFEEQRIGLAWSDDTNGQHEIYFQQFDWGARPLAPARRITRNGTSSLIPAIERRRDGFALAWNEYVPGADGHAGTSEIFSAIVR